MGSSSDNTFELRAGGCTIDPKWLFESDPRVGLIEPSCTETETTYLDEALPAYRPLQADEVPGESMRLLGWELMERDIPKTPSLGPRSSFVYLGDLAGAEPSCETVRAAVFDAVP